MPILNVGGIAADAFTQQFNFFNNLKLQREAQATAALEADFNQRLRMQQLELQQQQADRLQQEFDFKLEETRLKAQTARDEQAKAQAVSEAKRATVEHVLSGGIPGLDGENPQAKFWASALQSGAPAEAIYDQMLSVFNTLTKENVEFEGRQRLENLKHQNELIEIAARKREPAGGAPAQGLKPKEVFDLQEKIYKSNVPRDVLGNPTMGMDQWLSQGGAQMIASTLQRIGASQPQGQAAPVQQGGGNPRADLIRETMKARPGISESEAAAVVDNMIAQRTGAAAPAPSQPASPGQMAGEIQRVMASNPGMTLDQALNLLNHLRSIGAI